jgi:anti-sigma regulatory factor (Ser/Thr protein kinase)
VGIGDSMSGHADAVPGIAHPRRSSERSYGVGVDSPLHEPGFIALASPWPLASYLELGALPAAVASARSHTKAMLAEWGLARQGDLPEIAELLVSELLTNAYATTVDHQLGTPIRLRLATDRTALLIEVWDGNPVPPPFPAHKAPPTQAETGRGLFLIQALSTRWSWYSSRYLPGKVIWAQVAAGAAKCPAAEPSPRPTWSACSTYWMTRSPPVMPMPAGPGGRLPAPKVAGRPRSCGPRKQCSLLAT